MQELRWSVLAVNMACKGLAIIDHSLPAPAWYVDKTSDVPHRRRQQTEELSTKTHMRSLTTKHLPLVGSAHHTLPNRWSAVTAALQTLRMVLAGR